MWPWSNKRRVRASTTPPTDKASYEFLERLRRELLSLDCEPHVAGIADLTQPADDIAGRICSVFGPYPDEATAWTEAQRFADDANSSDEPGVFVPLRHSPRPAGLGRRPCRRTLV